MTLQSLAVGGKVERQNQGVANLLSENGIAERGDVSYHGSYGIGLSSIWLAGCSTEKPDDISRIEIVVSKLRKAQLANRCLQSLAKEPSIVDPSLP
jgi:hypothetical protein